MVAIFRDAGKAQVKCSPDSGERRGERREHSSNSVGDRPGVFCHAPGSEKSKQSMLVAYFCVCGVVSSNPRRV